MFGQAWTLYTPEQRLLVALLRELREEAGLRQVDVAEALDRPQSYARKYEAGDRRLDFVVRRALALDVIVALCIVVLAWHLLAPSR